MLHEDHSKGIRKNGKKIVWLRSQNRSCIFGWQQKSGSLIMENNLLATWMQSGSFRLMKWWFLQFLPSVIKNNQGQTKKSHSYAMQDLHTFKAYISLYKLRRLPLICM